jgi:hypothetical protein
MKRIFAITQPRELVDRGRIRYALMLAGGSVAGVMVNSWLYLFAAWGGSVLVWSAIRVYTPPAVLVLGTSMPALRLQQRIKHAVVPARVVSLLEWTEEIDGEISLDCIRVVDNERWWEAFVELAHFVPAIVVDRRLPSEFVEKELAHLSEEDLLAKCIFVTSSGPWADGAAAHAAREVVRIRAA